MLPSVRLATATTVLACLGLLGLTACAADGSDTAPQSSTASTPPDSRVDPQREEADAENGEEGGEAGDADQADEAAPAGEGDLVTWEEYDSDRAAYADSTVVLFFHADWCHSCQETDASLAADGVPAGLTIVVVGYDERTDLRQEYGVTVQHTFVKVDPESAERQDIWTGTITGADIADRAA